MNRSEFLKWLSFSPLAGVALRQRGEDIKQIEEATDETRGDLEELYQVFNEGKTVKIGGMDFYFVEMQTEYDLNRTTVSINLIARG
jgi:hypothetical protein